MDGGGGGTSTVVVNNEGLKVVGGCVVVVVGFGRLNGFVIRSQRDCPKSNIDFS
jgi:hypothetical protein